MAAATEKKTTAKPAEKKTAAKTETKKAPAKETKAAPKKAPAKTEDKKAAAKPAEKKTAAKPAAKEAPKKAEPKKKETKTWHIAFDDDKNKWGIRAEENSKATKFFKTKEEAEAYAKTLVANNEGSRIVFHKKDGKFQKSH